MINTTLKGKIIKVNKSKNPIKVKIFEDNCNSDVYYKYPNEIRCSKCKKIIILADIPEPIDLNKITDFIEISKNLLKKPVDLSNKNKYKFTKEEIQVEIDQLSEEYVKKYGANPKIIYLPSNKFNIINTHKYKNITINLTFEDKSHF